jgi:2-amino-4-hydroxy-6-hydroxymethyldihydropteridine diphosphokinase
MTTSLITECYVGLGSNLDNPYAHVLDALWDIDQIEQTDLDSFSSLYTSRPMGPQNQPPYVNAAACLHTRLDAQSLLEALQAIEQSHGRVRKEEQWGPRTLDLDILLFGNQSIRNQTLTVPHPGIAQREFVLYPLHELNKNLMIPNLGRIHRIKTRCYRNGLIQLQE